MLTTPEAFLAGQLLVIEGGYDEIVKRIDGGNDFCRMFGSLPSDAGGC